MIENLYKKITSSKKNTFIFILILTIMASIPILNLNGVMRGHDINFHLSRISALSDNIKNLNFSKVYPGYFNDYGYANGLFYPDLFLYFPAILKSIGINLITAYKIYIILINFLAISTIYISIKGISKNKYASILGTIIYAFSAYRLTDLYERAALGESLAFIFAPLIIYGIYEIIYRDYKKFYILVIGMSGLILSHIVSTYIIGIILFLFCIININRFLKEKKRILYLLLAAIITLLLTSYFLLPMLEQMTSQTFYYNNTSATPEFELAKRTIKLPFIILEVPYLCYLIKSKYWFPAGIGVIFIYLIYKKIKHKDIKDKFISDSYTIGIIFLLITTIPFIWKLNIIKKAFYMVQFPWRFYFITTLLLTIAGSILISKTTESKKILKNVFIISLISLISFTIISISKEKIKKIDSYDASYSEYLPVEVDRDYIKERGIIITSNNKTTHEFTKKGTNMEITFKQNYENTKLELPLIYYKGYDAKLNNTKINTYKTSNGLLGLKINDLKEGTIKVSYKGTKLSKITKYVSLITLISLITYIEVKHEK